MITGASDDAESLAVGALEWLVKAARDTGDGVAWPDTPADERTTPILYNGSSGVLPTLLDAWRYFGDDRYADMALRGARGVAAAVDEWQDSGLYAGVAGMAVVLRGVQRVLGDSAAGTAADRALDVVRSRYDGGGWNDWFELVVGNAGIALAALQCGDLGLVLLAVDRYARTAEPTAAGAQWEVQTGRVHRMLHLSHGTLGIVYALAAVGRAADRPDLIELALAGTADVVARNEAGPDGFLVPYSDPQQQHERIERHNYGWCHGPAGDAQAFRLLARVLPDDPAWPALADRCWHTVVNSGLPHRIRPGFWDNNGRCCGTAGVLALACDRQVEYGDGQDFAEVLVADLAARATADAQGVRWSNIEHRNTPSTLAPATGWAMGNAGIIRELLRHARITTHRDPHYTISFPEHPPTA
ncbi:lanthionine synthetase C family protein [Streptomyces sp. BH-SS-21]|uniref:Lanthionine synthetase C family protein n=1 Tax=Streptomyces liliiviolaceus TaxID=2823109 RepID=A0A941B816_9ACTN|nr:lanthionine synthetase LanC family protein [Streptomyces liliiviolaceus]MBQ0850407.1 lanthionine synthetase C family protein [Streptomyces liliiviolaceus]